MSRRAQRSKLCATPSKQRHATDDEAVEAGRAFEAMCIELRRPFLPVYVYPCPCLAWHVTHHSMSREGKFHRKVNP